MWVFAFSHSFTWNAPALTCLFVFARRLYQEPERLSVFQGEVLVQESHNRSPAELLLPISLPQNHSGHRGERRMWNTSSLVGSSVTDRVWVKCKSWVIKCNTTCIMFRFAVIKVEKRFLVIYKEANVSRAGLSAKHKKHDRYLIIRPSWFSFLDKKRAWVDWCVLYRPGWALLIN